MSEVYHAYIPYVNRPDLLKRAVDSVPSLWKNLTIVDNSENGIDGSIRRSLPDAVEIFTPPVPLSFSQSQNFFFRDAKWERNCRWVFWLHSDSEVPDSAVHELTDYAWKCIEDKRKWGVLFTYYDIFSAVNLDMIQEVGGYDTNIRDYKSDQDFYHRVRLAGWETINTEVEVEAIKQGHLGSQTIQSDEKLSFMNGITQMMSSVYYELKWGAEAGQEKFSVPFDRPDLFGRK